MVSWFQQGNDVLIESETVLNLVDELVGVLEDTTPVDVRNESGPSGPTAMYLMPSGTSGIGSESGQEE